MPTTNAASPGPPASPASSPGPVPDTASREAMCWLALSLTQGLGASRIRKLVEHFGRVDGVFQASLTELEATGMRAISAQSIATGKSLELAQEELAKASAANTHIVALSDSQYPPRLKEIYDPPVALFVKGDAALLCRPGIAMVGTRIRLPTVSAWPSG